MRAAAGSYLAVRCQALRRWARSWRRDWWAGEIAAALPVVLYFRKAQYTQVLLAWIYQRRSAANTAPGPAPAPSQAHTSRVTHTVSNYL